MATNGNGTALATVPSDAATTARVVESLVIRGDISALTPAERAKFYVQMCEHLGLDARTNPFALLKLNGKEILYPTRGATDQLAAMHRLNREIVDGPKVIDLQGTKLAIATCKATLPNGRFETATATVPLNDPLNALMKVETKAKRRATLSILGLGLLDESEFDTIPRTALGPTQQVDVTLANDVEPAELAELRDQLAGAAGDEIGGVIGAYGDLRRATNVQATLDAGFNACIEHVKARRWNKVSEFKAGAQAIEREVAAELRAAQTPAMQRETPPPTPPDEEHPFLASMRAKITSAKSGKALLALATNVDATPDEIRGALVECYVAQFERVIAGIPTLAALDACAKAIVGIKPARLAAEVTAGTAHAIAKRRAELTQPPPAGSDDEEPIGGEDDPEREAIQADDGAGSVARADDALRAYVAAKVNIHELENGLVKHLREFDGVDDDAFVLAVREQAERLHEPPMALVNLARRVLHARRGKRAA